MTTGGFTIPGESGHEALSLSLARRWGADAIRNSDGTALSGPLLESGLDVYATLCLVREDRKWADSHLHHLQQTFLMSAPVPADSGTTQIELLDGYSTDQFTVNLDDGLEYWQVFDRTSGAEVARDLWQLATSGDDQCTVVVRDTEPGHIYTVNFLALRIWEEISMYNHLTNGWGDRERLVALEPRYPEVAAHLLAWLDAWCRENPAATTVRFTSMFYNFAWFWGSDHDLPQVYADWASYDFTVTPLALRQFMAQTGLVISSEDFVNAGRYTSGHNPPSRLLRAWMEFVGEFVRELSRRCVEIVHSHGKRAMVFYDDSWIGLEPHSGRFREIGFDGIIKAVFSAYEVRLCAAVPTRIHEVRLHPYLFPVDLQGRATFAPGGDPAADLWRYWRHVRRGMLRDRIDRIGLGGYLSLVEDFPDFQGAVAEIAAQHRLLAALHSSGAPEVEPIKVGVLTSWGSLRTWSTSGHLHEHPDLSLTHVLEALAGLPYAVEFLALDSIEASGVPTDLDVVITGGPAGSAWSGGPAWRSAALVASLRRWVRDGGGIIGIEEPSATDCGLGRFQLADVFGLDRDTGDRRCLMRRAFDVTASPDLLRDGAEPPIRPVEGIRLERGGVQVVAATDGIPLATVALAGAGRAVYLAGLTAGPPQRRLLANAIQIAAGRSRTCAWSTRPEVDVATFESARRLVLTNATDAPVRTVLVEGLRRSEVEVPANALLCREF